MRRRRRRGKFKKRRKKEEEKEKKRMEEEERRRKYEEEKVNKRKKEVEERRKNEEDEKQKRMREQMENQAEEKKKKEEDDIIRSKFEISIAGEYFPNFTLNLTQQIFDIQKDKASEGKNQEHTLAHKEALKEKVVDYSKGSIERGVKERKSTERDHDDSDFIYPKQKKKTIEDTFHSLRLRFLSLISARQRRSTHSRKSES